MQTTQGWTSKFGRKTENDGGLCRGQKGCDDLFNMLCLHCCHGRILLVLTFIIAVRVVEFSNGGTKLERFMSKNEHTQRKLLNFENWVNGEVSKIGYHFSK